MCSIIGDGFWFWQRSAGSCAGNGTDRRCFFIVEDSFGQMSGFYRDFGFNKLGHVIDPDQRIIEGRIFLRQDKRFVHFAGLVDITEERAGESAIKSFAIKSNPPAVT